MKRPDLFYKSSLLSLFLISSLFIAGSAYPSEKFRLQVGAKGNLCLKCHEEFKKTLQRPFLHPLLKTGECIGCHDPHASLHKNLLTAAPTKLCSSCHQKVLPEEARSVHKLVKEANCKQCHDSHGSSNQYILLKSGNELCLDCHKEMSDSIKKVKRRHKALDKEKGCLNCHEPHASAKFGSLLRSEPPQLCNRCHKADGTELAQKHMNYPVADADCGSCHDPHGSDAKAMLYANAHAPVAEKKCTECHQRPSSSDPLRLKEHGTSLCQACHKEMFEKTFSENRVHWPLVDHEGCSNCHDPHAAKQKKLLKNRVTNLCGGCHSDTVQLQELTKSNPKNPNLCEPVKKGDCIVCHNPHASDNILLIAQADISVDLCGQCHKWETHSTHPIGEKIIDQRNKNLTVDCLSCHRGCGTLDNPKMLNFETTYDLCVDCHKERRR